MSKESLTFDERTVFFARIAHTLSVGARTWIIVFMIIEFLGFIPILGIFGIFSNKLFGHRFWPIAAIIWLVLYLLTALRLQCFHCPQCGKNRFGNFSAFLGGYVSQGRRYSLFSKECANCRSQGDSN